MLAFVDAKVSDHILYVVFLWNTLTIFSISLIANDINNASILYRLLRGVMLMGGREVLVRNKRGPLTLILVELLNLLKILSV